MRHAPAAAFYPAGTKTGHRTTPDTDREVLAAILLLAMALRLIALPGAGFAHQDELFQYLEQAHRLAFGTGIVPWEYRYGMRGWLLPLLLSAPMKAGDLLAPGTMLYLALPRIATIAVSLGTVAGAWTIGRRLSPLHGALAAFALAVWPELIHFAPHVLTEPLAVALIVPGAALLASSDSRRLIAAGLLLGVAGLLRFQYLPAIAALLLVSAGRRRAAWPALVAGGLLAAWIGGCIDLAMGQTPFGWLVENVRQNLILHRADGYGVAGPLAYAEVVKTLWAGWLLPILVLAAIGARRQPALAAAALVNFALHMAVGHKEYRFILLTTTLAVLLAALGTAAIVARMRDRRAAALAFAAWGVAAATLGVSGRTASFDSLAAPARLLFARLAHDPAACGVSIVATSFADTGGYTLLHRRLSLYAYSADDAAELRRDARGFDRLIVPTDRRITLPPDYSRAACVDGGAGYAPSCLYIRRGACAQISTRHEINRVLVRLDQ